MRPGIFQTHFAAHPIGRQGINPLALGKTFRKIGVEFCGDFAPPPLRLDYAGDGDERFGYSKISRVKRLRNFMPAALRIVRMERAVRPCLPMTLRSEERRVGKECRSR